jgi:DNA-binding XRE family transcriptional regulator
MSTHLGKTACELFDASDCDILAVMQSDLGGGSSSVGMFGRCLRALREEAGLTQKELAKRAGLHPQGIVKLERGEREPAWATVLALAEALGVTCLAFLAPNQQASPGSTVKTKPAKRKRRSARRDSD